MKKLGFILTILLVLSFVVGAIGCGEEDEEDNAPAPDLNAGDQVIEFRDPNLEALIRDTIERATGQSIETIYKSDLVKLPSLVIGPDDFVNDITGLEHCANLTLLMIIRSHIMDISPLSKLTQLTDLVLRSNNIWDLAPLTGLANLNRLELTDNSIKDISPLANLTNLNFLFLYDNRIKDISPVANLTQLAQLAFDYNMIKDLSPVSKLANLEILNFNNNYISDLEPISNLTKLKSLELSYNIVSDLSPIVNLPSLVTLGIEDNQISDLSPLLTAKGLRNVDSIKYDYGGEITFGEYGNRLHFNGNPLSDKSIYEYIPQLEEMDILIEWSEEE